MLTMTTEPILQCFTQTGKDTIGPGTVGSGHPKTEISLLYLEH